MTKPVERIRVAAIMAGGSGERFWPLSRGLRPKQLLCLTDDRLSMLAESILRVAPVTAPEHVYIVTGKHLADPIRRGHTGIPDVNVLAEPCKRNTAGALAWMTANLLAKHDQPLDSITLAVITADHLIGDPDRFLAAMRAAMKAAEEDELLVTLGVTPTRPETGYGYIQTGPEPIRPYLDGETAPAYKVLAFREKPNQEQAEAFIAQGGFYWNSGMFFWRLDVFMTELERSAPAIASAILDMGAALRAGEMDLAESLFAGLEDISIDYALMEHTRLAGMVRADFPWDDIGSWPSLERTRPKDGDGNVVHGDALLVDSRNCIVYNDLPGERMIAGVLGMEDVVVVVTEDAILVAPKHRAQEVREIVKGIKARGLPQV